MFNSKNNLNNLDFILKEYFLYADKRFYITVDRKQYFRTNFDKDSLCGGLKLLVEMEYLKKQYQEKLDRLFFSLTYKGISYMRINEIEWSKI